MNQNWDVIIVGAGHAGIEAALAAAKLNQKTLLITMTVDNIGAMSCNPAIGGLAKGHLVKEIDALGGIMGKAADETAIQFRILNSKKGPAVQATRCQSDMIVYKDTIRNILENQANLSIIQAEVTELIIGNNTVCGVKTNIGETINAKAVVLTTGTFLNGTIHIGHNQYPAGRAWEFPAEKLSDQLKSLGLKIGRLKTGTTPRLDGRTINFDKLEAQPGDAIIRKFSFWPSEIKLPQVPCYITYTNQNTHQVIMDNIKKSAMYSGAITGVGARYCPSIEDKVSRFPEKDRHQIFIEPTSLKSYEYYPNGISTSLPLNVQTQYLRSIEGLENVDVVRAGYAIEYDYIIPTQLKSTLELKDIKGLYCGGQINGTSGYEEAAAQGLMAGINAALKNKSEEPFILLRNEAYTGVLLDDLVSKGTEEPYRMFTSRAEYRLSLREDNADQRLSQKGYDIGLLDAENYRLFSEKNDQIRSLSEYIKKIRVKPDADINTLLEKHQAQTIENRMSVQNVLKKPNVTLQLLETVESQEDLLPIKNWNTIVKKYVETEIKYEGYIIRQESQMKRYLKIEAIRIPDQIDYDSINGLSTEVIQKLKSHRPQTLGQASKISGVTPAAITILMVAFQKRRFNKR
ncbi:MAG: tRNA uridine-5-carboxymethylaminomethyl(34) synthesis enzyme MnmG [Deltaproteobacteria bacterium]|jgi:tRNA uridine 5-carboxymethylaminomethyl modification enzyme|nr:tRNA uridine-5-carboxymethylaminomethyl(34) synthesis enzyme MnmG [Deltaproteobacteria bacterium]MBT4526813.1 tRNA uridine-5-carboxymethylaminomethyl(34) synthesis enzyme MnmG [Deltaproteobacteria bacterium]